MIDVVIPTRNESENIVPLIDEINKAVADAHIIIVDDSDDNRTIALAFMNGAEIHKGQGKGLGQAIVDGINISKNDIVVVMDADGSHPAEKIPELVAVCQHDYDMAIGSRYIKDGSIAEWSFNRRLISRVASMIAYPITGIHDNASGFFCFKRSILDGVKIKPESWKIALEVLVKANAKIKEVPIHFSDRRSGKSKFNTKQAIIYLRHLAKLALYKWVRIGRTR